MNVQITISLGQGEELAQKVTDMVPSIMEAIGGDLEKDSITMQISAASYPQTPAPAVSAEIPYSAPEPRVIGG